MMISEFVNISWALWDDGRSAQRTLSLARV